MANITLYGAAGGTSFRCHWLLHELDVAYTTAQVDLSKGEHKQAAFLALNPAGQIPVLVIDEFHLAESVAINSYLAERFDAKLLGATPEERATALRWTLWTVLNPERHFAALAAFRWTGKHDEVAEAAARERLPVILPVLEQHLATSAYIAGAAFTVADINCGSSFRYADMAEYDLAAYPNIAAWRANVTARKAYNAAG